MWDVIMYQCAFMINYEKPFSLKLEFNNNNNNNDDKKKENPIFFSAIVAFPYYKICFKIADI